jgi:hypothetical protein
MRRLDSKRRVFGAHVHRYLSTPVSESNIAICEQQLGCTLPEDFRRFLMEVGHGAGPYYGVWDLKPAVEWLQHLGAELATEEGIEIMPSQPFPLTGDDLRDIERKVREESKHPCAGAKYPSHGCLPICHQGCIFWSVLVLQGEFAGKVWDVCNPTAHHGQWYPALRPPGRLFRDSSRQKVLPRLPKPPTFVEWYRGWIERCLMNLGGP